MVEKQRLLSMLTEARSAGYKVFAPVKNGNLVLIEQVDEPEAVHLGHVLTVNTLKDVLLPRYEPLAAFDTHKQTLKGADDTAPKTLIFGCRPCDAAALAILDAILLDPARDVRYARRREQTILVTLACSHADEACFCTSMGFGPHDATGSDVMVLPSGGAFLLRAVTATGKDFLSEMGMQEDAGGIPDRPPDLARDVNVAGLKEWLDANFDHPRWKAVSEGCVSCGTCYYLCPTCHCFEIVDESGLSRGQRLRIWDCCSFSSFTRMASHQPRVGRHARYRQRIMHKFSYCADNIERVACVGDGRCVRFCPYGVDIREVLETLRSEG
jgi:ferredoxin